TKLIAVTCSHRSAREFARALRQNNPPIIVRVEEDEVVFDLRTVLDGEEETEIVQAITRLGAEAGPAGDLPRPDASY
ncbi:MAG: hypothetical protein KGM47_07270, partial [Acidobacteriota bacterium]|nr:hypothetical protein [Acidobacteriota bacterium]